MSFQGDPWSWLQNSKCMDQFAVQYESNQGGIQLDVYWHMRNGQPTLVDEAHRDVSWHFLVLKM